MEKIIIKNLSFKYQNKYILDKVNLEIPSGKISALIGPNGSGKTTLLKIISGLQTPSSGEILAIYEGNQIPFLKEKIGFVFDEPLILPYLSGFEYLRFISFQRKIKNNENKIIEYLDKYDLPKSNEILKNYSKGMIQKISIISILILDFTYIVFDEPFTFLDDSSIVELSNDLIKLRDAGVGILITSHQHDILNRISDLTFTLNNTQIMT